MGKPWVPFDQQRWHHQKLPGERVRVLVRVPAHDGMPEAMAVGYLRYAAGCSDSPFFVVPGVGGTPSAWRDCLPRDERDKYTERRKAVAP